MSNNYVKDSGVFEGDYTDRLKPKGLEDYVREKIPEVRELEKTIYELEVSLTQSRAKLKRLVAEEVEYLREATGMDAMITKTQALSGFANEGLKEAERNKKDE